jgi:phosphoribosylformylglycinamidine synthase subunit PurQ / glutaminase
MNVLVLAGSGLHCHEETRVAYRKLAAEVQVGAFREWQLGKLNLDRTDLLHIPGGFSFGDTFGAGKVLANRLRYQRRGDGLAMWDELQRFLSRGGAIVGICNGFQALLRAGLLPNLDGQARPRALLLPNVSGDPARVFPFVNDWVQCEANGLLGKREVTLPVRHGEGRLWLAPDVSEHEQHQIDAQVVLRYCHEFNGSWRKVAGMVGGTGKVLGLMPHPEAFAEVHHHPNWTVRPRPIDGLSMMDRIVRWARS